MSVADFFGKKVVITGAGGGLGRALVAVFRERGGAVTACDQSLAAMSGLDAQTKQCFDLTDLASLSEIAATILNETGVPDVVINNAGWTRAETMASLTPENIYQEIQLNLTGVMTFTSLLLDGMKKRGSGSIVFISSINSLLHFGNPAYSAAKAGVNAYARAIAVEYGAYGIRANAVCPGSIRTPAWDHRLNRDPGIPEKLEKLYPLRRMVECSEVAEAVAFLASEQASGITGICMPVDAGLTAGNRHFIDDVLGGV